MHSSFCIFRRSSLFDKACAQVREALYGLTATSIVGPNLANCSTGTAFMVSPGVLATAAHGVHVENNPSKPIHSQFEVIRSPDIGKQMENATLIAEDPLRD